MDIVLKNWIYFLSAICSIFFAKSVDASNDTYVGCYNEFGTDEVFVRTTETRITDLSSLAPDGCRERCRKDLLYSVAGLWGGTNCYCVKELTKGQIVQVNDSLCYSPCPGKPAEFCGGSNASYIFSVYSACPQGLYGENCNINCNCHDNKRCTVTGICPDNKCTQGWIVNRTISNRDRCSIDIDECQTKCSRTNSLRCHNCNSALHQKCKNTEGSFMCICAEGFEETNSGTCADIDECAIGNHTCSQLCNNTAGSYNCYCPSGYQLEGRFDCRDIDECSKGSHGCQQICNNTEGSYNCSCSSGYELDGRFNCKDINECARGTHKCNQSCSNTEGNYTCSCPSGYELDGRFDCKDINECVKNTSGCEQICNNTVGNYTCGCNNGFRQSTTNRLKCNDIDECKEGSSNCNQTCHNRVGNYTCSCKRGYELENDRHMCKDIDECVRITSGCQQTCNNTVGNYTCGCYDGFRPNTTNRLKCDDIDECKDNSSKCSQNCHNSVGNYSCSCRTGYELDTDRHMCKDINECSRNISNCSQKCQNNEGSYKCECDIGFELHSDKHHCEDIDECNRRTSRCNQNCTNTHGWYNCSCYTGYRLENEFNCIDVDECAVNKGGCEHYCKNTAGSFICSCRPGYNISTKIGDKYNCTDIDECAERISGCRHKCNNTVGGYNCSCNSGFQLDSDLKNCSDIDECAKGISGCRHKCNNTVGGYNCSCNSGFQLDSDLKNCSDVNECSSADTHKCIHNCHNENGSYYCSCFSGHYSFGQFDCKKDYTGMILGVVVTILIIWIVVIVIILLKVKQVFPFDQPRFINTCGKREPNTVPNKNGTKEQMELKKTPAKSNVAAAVTTDAAAKKFKKTCIVVKDFKKYVEKKKSSDGFDDEFRSIPMVSELSYEFAQSQALKSKNRFKNILPYDENRVVLNEVNNDPLTTYINASVIQGYNPQDKIIASHGPTPNTVNDFWRMIWQYEVSVIVMVTKCMEDAKRKCEQYWPLEGSMECGELTISMMSTEKWPDYIITRLKVTKESSSRQLVHLLFTAWPDHGVPDHATSLLSFRRAARNVIVADKFFVVHCSAGVGRTGTFLAIDFLLQEAKDKGSVDVYKYLEGLRDQRMHAVQTLDQYEFIHLALLEAMTLGETVASCKALSAHHKHLCSLNPLTGKTYIQTEFDMLQEMHPPLSAEETSAALEKENVSRNRNRKLVPGDVNRVLLKDTENESNYINAVYVSSYRLKDAFISAELPLKETLKDFWAMVLDYNCKLVAFLDTSGALNDLNNHLLVPVKTNILVARHKVWTHSLEPKRLSDLCGSYLVAVANPPGDDEDIYANTEEIPSFKVLVLHFHLSGRLADLLPQVNEQIKTSSLNIKDNGPVVIVSRDGVNPTGQYIAVSNLLEMATSQHEVDVFNAVHNIKKTQPYFITSLGEYEMIFDALVAEGDTSTYANI